MALQETVLYEQLKAVEQEGWRSIGALRKLHNLCTFIKGSEQKSNAFKALTDGMTIHVDHETRWNSWYEMFHESFPHKPALNQFVDEHSECRLNALSYKD